MSLLYSNANIDLPALRTLEIPEARGRFHQPYGFGQYVDDVVEVLDSQGILVTDSEFEVSDDRNKFFGALEVSPKQGQLITADEWKFIVGLRGSHDQSIRRELCVGSQVLVCSNLCFHGSLGNIATKQTTNIAARLPGLIRGALAGLPEQAENLEHKFLAYQQAEFKPRWGDAALVEIHRRGGLSGAQLGRAVQEWDRPSHEEHAEHGYSAWRLLNACTEAVKPTGQQVNHNIIENRTRIADGFLSEVVDLSF